MISVLISLLLTLRGLVGPESRCTSRYWPCAINCRCFNGHAHDGCAHESRPLALGVAVDVRGPPGERHSSSSSRRPSSPGIAKASACTGRGRVAAASDDRPSSRDVRALIRTMSEANPLWGAPRIHGEL